MCFTLGGGGSRGDVTQNSYINRRPWEQTDARPMSLGDHVTDRTNNRGRDPMTGRVNNPDFPQNTPTKRSSLTTGGSA